MSHKLLLFIAVLFSSLSLAQSKSDYPFTEIPGKSVSVQQTRYIFPTDYRAYKLDVAAIRNLLSNTTGLIKLQIPFPDGSVIKFIVTESSIMEPKLAKQFPELKTYIVNSEDTKLGYSGRIDMTPLGFHAMIFAGEETMFMDPYALFNDQYYLSYYKKDLPRKDNGVSNQPCVVENEAITKQIQELVNLGYGKSSGNTLRTYRLALACTGEYAAFYGGTVAGAMNGIVTSINRVDGVYEKEAAIRMVLIANNSSLVYTNASTDPYTNNNGSTMLGQNISTCNSVIGSANYDIGHVFSTGGGGVAYLGCVCGSSKAGGVTGSSSPIGDGYDIDYVAHEMGHQFGGNHTFNSVTSSCGGGNRAASAAYEPGSGTTIMAYAGICGADDIQPHSDPYFHVKSLEEIIAYTTAGGGNSCAVQTSTGNSGPLTVTIPSGGFTIPYNTPFSLNGSAVDPEGDPLYYCWEEYDLGPSGAPNSPSGNAPIFRSFNPTSQSRRIFPKLADILGNTQVKGEILPSYTRSLSFKLIARDNKMGGGGMTSSSAVTFNVTNASGPFTVTSPNTAVTFPALSTQTITWNVANTNTAPVNCASVNILLSTDGGQNFNITLASSTPNDGSEAVIIPANQTSTARIKIEAADNIFFDLSNANFSITAPVPVELVSFKVSDTKAGAKLEWQTATEINNMGFAIERSSDKKSFEQISFVKGNGTITYTKDYSYLDKSVSSGVFSYRLKQIDNDGSYKYSNVVDINMGMPDEFVLEQNYPNPFNPSTNITFNVPFNANVTIGVYDVLGVKVADVVSSKYSTGRYSAEFNSAGISSGVYFYKMTADADGKAQFSKIMKMVILK